VYSLARKKVSEELTKEMIVEEANVLFLEKGFHGVSMRSIAQKLGVSHGALYYHFDSKTEMFQAIVERYFDMLNKKLEESKQLKGSDGTLFVLLGFIEFGLTYQTPYQFMFMKIDEKLDPLLFSAPNISLEKFHETLQYLNNYQLRTQDIQSTFIALHGFVSHYIGRTVTFKEAEEAAKAYCKFLVKALVN
jgi:AcrR family transcriptional regulator